jgi:hypothetical protein
MVTGVTASVEPPIDIAAQAKGAKKVVIATVTDVESLFDTNDYGDRLIVSRVSYRVDETMKGPRETTGVVTVEGGSVGDLTLKVSDMPVMTKGDRAVLFLDDSAKGGQVPHGRGKGLLKIDGSNHVTGTTLTLDEVRAAVQEAVR